MIRLVSLGLIALGFTCSLTHADVIAPGTKRIDHSIVVDNLKDFPGYAYFLCEYCPFEAEHLARETLIEAGTPLSAGRLAGGYSHTIVGIPKDKLESLGGKPQRNWFQGRAGFMPPEGVVIATKNLSSPDSISKSDPTEKIITHLKFSLKPKGSPGVEGAARLFLKVVGEDRFDRAGKPLKPPGTRQQGDTKKNGEKASASASIWLGLPLIALMAIGFLAAHKRSEAQR